MNSTVTVATEVDRLKQLKPLPLSIYKKIPRTVLVELLKRGGWSGNPDDYRLHQLQGIWAGVRRPRVLFKFEQGTGKTRILLALYVHHAQFHVGSSPFRGLVLVPNGGAVYDWRKEAALLAPNLRLLTAPEDLEKRRGSFLADLEAGNFDLAIMDYPTLQVLFSELDTSRGRAFRVSAHDRLKALGQSLSWIGIDEIHYVKTPETLRFKMMTRLVKPIPYRYGASGTLFNHDPEEIWAQMYLLDQGETLGASIQAFYHLFCRRAPDRFALRGFKWVFDDDNLEAAHALLAGTVMTYDLNECVDLPGLHFERPLLLLTQEQRDLYVELVKTSVQAARQNKTVAVWADMRRVLSGFMPGAPPTPLVDSPKLAWLRTAVKNHREPWVVFYEYTETGRHIVRTLEEHGYRVGWLYSGTESKIELRERWERKEIDILVVQNSVGAQALNLQRARRLVFFESPASAITRAQAEKRVYRMGQTKECYIYDLFFKGTAEEAILRRVNEGISLQRALFQSFSSPLP